MPSPSSIGNDSELKDVTTQILDLACPPVTFVRLRRMFLLLARAHFSDSGNYGKDFEEMLECREYNLAEPEKSTLHVDLLHAFGQGDTRPAVYIGVQNGAFIKNVINDRAGVSDDTATKYGIKTAQTQVRAIFIDEQADLALALAETWITFIEGMRDTLMPRMGLYSLDTVSLDDVTYESKRAEAMYRTDVKVNIQFGLAVASVVESHRLKKMAYHLTQKDC